MQNNIELMTPKFSVVIPTYNRINILPKAIQSVVSQTLKDWELVIVDDCSTDGTCEMVKEKFGHDPRISLLRTPVNSKQGAARNLGIQSTKAPLIAFLDSDDTWHPEFLEKQWEKFAVASADLGLVYCGCYISNGENIIKTYAPSLKGWIEKKLYLNLKGLAASNSGIVVRRSVFNKVGLYDSNLQSQVDLDLFVRIARYFRIDFIEGAYSTITTRSNNRISANLSLKIQGEIQFFEKHELRLRELSLYHHVARKLARKHVMCSKDLKMSYSLLFKVIRYRPTYIYAYLYLLKSPMLYLKQSLPIQYISKRSKG